MKHKSIKRRLFAIVLSLAMVFGTASAAFAAWPSFQKDVALNNGVIDNDSYTYATGSSPNVNVYTALTSGGWSGIDVSPLVNVENGTAYAYVLHTASSGAKIAKVNLASPTTIPAGWTSDGVTVSSSGGFQLSTPLIANGNIYSAANVYGNIVTNDEFSVYTDSTFEGWTVAKDSGTTISQSTIATDNYALKAAATSAGSHQVSATQSGTFTIPTAQLSNLRVAGGIKLTSVSNATVKVYVNDVEVGYYYYGTAVSGADELVLDNGLYCWNENVTTSSATTPSIKVVIDFTTSAANGSVELDYAELYEQTSGIGVIKDIETTTTPTVEPIISGIVGQINTPISYDAATNSIYFGTYTTNGKYYKVDLDDNSFVTHNMTGNSTYWAGAAICGDYVIYGTEDGILYAKDKETMRNIRSESLETTSYIRSTINAVKNSDGTYNLYFTSRTSNNGYLWCYKFDTSLKTFTELWSKEIGYSNSTPVVSGNYVYVGVAGASPKIVCYNISTQAKVWEYTGMNGPVQSSPIVKSVASGGSTTDYIYFTTNIGAGNGYCLSYTQGGSAPTLKWDTSSSAGKNFALQGFAAGGGYLVFGNDSSNLFIVSPASN